MTFLTTCMCFLIASVYFEEAFKMKNILEEFHKHHHEYIQVGKGRDVECCQSPSPLLVST